MKFLAVLVAAVLRVAANTACMWGITSIFGVSLGFGSLVGLGVLVSILLPASSND